MIERAAVTYSPRERLVLASVSAAGLVGLNGIFIYGLFFRPDLVRNAMTNPLAWAFVAEALLLTGVLAYLLPRWGVSRMRWGWFVLLSLAGSLAFALPFVLLAASRRPRDAADPA